MLAAVAGFVAVDDAAGLHERVTSSLAAWLGTGARGDALFLVPYVPLLAAAFGILWAASRRARLDVGRVMRLGLWLLVGALAARAAFALVLTAGFVPSQLEKAIGGAASHDLELSGWIMLAAGLLAQAAGSSAPTRRGAR